MKDLIKTLSKTFVDNWEQESIKQDFSLRFPQLPNFILYINKNTTAEQQKLIFSYPGICRLLEDALFYELRSRLQSSIEETDAEYRAA